MASLLIVEIAGEPWGALRGKEAVGAYWQKALRLSPNLRFEKLGVFLGIAPCPVEFRVVATTRWDPYATFWSDATVAAAGRRAVMREGMWT